MLKKYKVLLLEDEISIRSFIRINLEKENYKVFETSSGSEALKIFSEEKIDLAILDIMLPGISGLDVCEQIRSKDQHIGIIMLTAKNDEEDKILGFQKGADDYIVKPFSPKELLARTNALLKRIAFSRPIEKEFLILNERFKIDFLKKRVFKDGQEVDLTPTEYELLSLLISNREKALSRDEILDNIWGKNFFGDKKTVDVNIRRIRKKIEDDSSKPKYIKTVRGYGYVWNQEEE